MSPRKHAAAAAPARRPRHRVLGGLGWHAHRSSRGVTARRAARRRVTQQLGHALHSAAQCRRLAVRWCAAAAVGWRGRARRPGDWFGRPRCCRREVQPLEQPPDGRSCFGAAHWLARPRSASCCLSRSRHSAGSVLTVGLRHSRSDGRHTVGDVRVKAGARQQRPEHGTSAGRFLTKTRALLLKYSLTDYLKTLLVMQKSLHAGASHSLTGRRPPRPAPRLVHSASAALARGVTTRLSAPNKRRMHSCTVEQQAS